MKAETSTAQLVQLAKAGDREAFDRLVALFRPRLEAAVATRIGPGLRAKLEVEDVVQETILRALRSIESFEWRGDESFLRWLAGIAEHILRDQADRERLRRAVALESDVAGEGTSPSVAARREERFSRLEQAIEVLPPEYREVILLARVEGLPVQKIAERLGMTPNAVSQRLWRALRKLRDEFGETESFHLPPRRLGGKSGQHGGQNGRADG